MRWILITLIFINLGYLAWQLYDSASAQPVVVKSSQPRPSDNLRLLSERTQKSLRDFEAVKSIQNIQTELEEQAFGECSTIGPFPDLFAGRQVVNQLASLDMHAEVKAVDQATGDNDYRVLIPPLNSLQESFRKLRELKARNIDSYVLTAGEYEFGISLGVFTTKKLALQARNKMEKDGYEVRLVEIPRLHREYWLYPTEGTELEIDDAWWQQLKNQHAGIEKRRLKCE